MSLDLVIAVARYFITRRLTPGLAKGLPVNSIPAIKYYGYKIPSATGIGLQTMRRQRKLCAFIFEDVSLVLNRKPVVGLNSSKTDQFGPCKILP